MAAGGEKFVGETRFGGHFDRYLQDCPDGRKVGDKILDTHLGSGSSRRAAYDFGLDFVGCEIDADYFARQEEAWAEYTVQTRLF